MVDLETLMARATAGGQPDARRMFKPSMTYQVMHDPYAVWCGCHVPPEEAVEEESRYDRLRKQWGREHEARWVREHFPGVVEIGGIEPLRRTLQAMQSGARAIHAPQLWSLGEEMYGLGDVLIRWDEAPSDLGGYHYRVVEVKSAEKVQDYHVYQAVFYNRILGSLQGLRPPEVHVALKRRLVAFPVAPYESSCDRILSKWRGLRDGDCPELPGFDDASSPWRVYTNKLLKERGDLTAIPVISASARRKFAARLGVSKAGDLDRLTSKDFQKALGPKAGLNVWHKYQACRTGKPVPGGRLEIPRRKRLLYFDFETCDGIHPTVAPHVYLIGVCDGATDRYHSFVAHGAADEERMFRDFAAFVGDPAEACLYHWHRYETDQMALVARRHPSLAGLLGGLTRSCVDLKECIKKGVYFGTRSYSIKQVGPFLGFHWRQAGVDGMESMVLYWEWLETGDPAKLAAVLAYNEDDCRAMVHIDRAVQFPPSTI